MTINLIQELEALEKLNSRSKALLDSIEPEFLPIEEIWADIEDDILPMLRNTKLPTWHQKDFAQPEWVSPKDIYSNIKVQRDLVKTSLANILKNFHPKRALAISVNKYNMNGKYIYTVWDGQHTAVALLAALKLGMLKGIIPEDFKVLCTVSEFENPKEGEKFANDSFIEVNGSRERIAPYFELRARYYSGRHYNSQDPLDTRAVNIFDTLIENEIMLNAKPRVTNYLETNNTQGIKNNTNYNDSRWNITPLSKSCKFLKQYCSTERGIHGTFFNMMMILYTKVEEFNIKFDFKDFGEWVINQGGGAAVALDAQKEYTTWCKRKGQKANDRDTKDLMFALNKYFIDNNIENENLKMSFGLGEWNYHIGV